MTRSAVFLMNFKAFENDVKHCLEYWYIFSIETKTKEKTEN